MYDTKKSFEYENGFYLTSQYSRMGRLIAHYELYKKIAHLEGEIVECGVFKGASLMRFIDFIQLFEKNYSNTRKVIGFDVFGEFPETEFSADKKELEDFKLETNGGVSINIEELESYIHNKSFSDAMLIKGDIIETVPRFVSENPDTKIALLNIDTDIFEPCEIILKHLAPMVVPGGLIIFDDYGVFKGETQLADEYASNFGFRLQKFEFSNVPYFLIKE